MRQLLCPDFRSMPTETKLLWMRPVKPLWGRPIRILPGRKVASLFFFPFYRLSTRCVFAVIQGHVFNGQPLYSIEYIHFVGSGLEDILPLTVDRLTIYVTRIRGGPVSRSMFSQEGFLVSLSNEYPCHGGWHWLLFSGLWGRPFARQGV